MASRQKKQHLHEDHHFQVEPAVEPTVAPIDEAVVENPTVPMPEPIGSVDQEDSSVPAVEESLSTGETIPNDSAPMNVTSTEKITPMESPSEEDVRETMSINLHGLSPIETAPRGGLPVIVTDDIAGIGVLAFWKRTRVFNGKRWDETGKWMNHQTGVDVPFEPKYWKERY